MQDFQKRSRRRFSSVRRILETEFQDSITSFPEKDQVILRDGLQLVLEYVGGFFLHCEHKK